MIALRKETRRCLRRPCLNSSLLDEKRRACRRRCVGQERHGEGRSADFEFRHTQRWGHTLEEKPMFIPVGVLANIGRQCLSSDFQFIHSIFVSFPITPSHPSPCVFLLCPSVTSLSLHLPHFLILHDPLLCLHISHSLISARRFPHSTPLYSTHPHPIPPFPLHVSPPPLFLPDLFL